MAKQSEDLIDEAHGNLKEDREKLKEFAELLNKALSIGEALDPLAKIGLTEQFARLSGELTKNNSLLIELAKLRAKKEILTKPKKDGFDEEEADTMFDEIETEPGVAEDDDDGSN